MNSKGESVLSYADYAIARIDEAVTGNQFRNVSALLQNTNRRELLHHESYSMVHQLLNMQRGLSWIT